MSSVHLLAPEPLGDGLISTAVVRYLLAEVPAISKLTVWTTKPWLFASFADERRFTCRSDLERMPPATICLSDYLERLPHRRVPPQHHVRSMLDVVREHLGGTIPVPAELPLPLLSVSEADEQAASQALASLSEWRTGRALVWLCPCATTPNRNPVPPFWTEVARLLSPRATLVELLGPGEAPVDDGLIRSVELSPGAAGALMRRCTAGVAVDTFGLHLAAAAGFDKVVAVLGSSHPDCVCYPGNRAVYRVTPRTCVCQPCGNHGYADEQRILETMPRAAGRFRSDNRCLFPDVPCLSTLEPHEVAEALHGWL